MRPTGSALVYVLATRGSSEEEFAQRQMRHLARKGNPGSGDERRRVTSSPA